MVQGKINVGQIDIVDDSSVIQSKITPNGIYLGGTASANLLDDYEEGTWTPVVRGSGTAGSYTYDNISSSYTKIGNKVILNVQLNNITEVSSGTGNFKISGLPFNPTANAVGAIWLTSVDLNASTKYAISLISGNSDGLFIQEILDNSDVITTPISSLTNGTSDIIATITYETNV